MSPNPFDPSFDQLPEIISIFPLTGVLLLPRGKLPLNIFEPRYLAMTDDALSGNRMIGIIQPSDPLSRASAPPVYPIGCAGRITSFSETDDGRYLITLTGVCRFEVVRELPIVRGYRRVTASWERFADDLAEPGPALFDRARLVEGLRTYFKIQGISANWDAIEATPDERLVTSLAMICPFEPSEKQALLECGTLSERASMMIAIIEMAVLDKRDGDTMARH
ncbi:LON peptidase substrate-binding domain-containing protein [Skermanella rosea]|uniref:LON peptidase substrate-binding domain-containing protein n=1 Tax=Skermanella rosea TaxID=1817965 RepID=UPI001932E64E|nr:LON peptidase substrate-binding domain-containing protein [Skermanella rosea]UEM03512.1 LON peptidase substrate-binding domain-containing protein [Skermanella rosea]